MICIPFQLWKLEDKEHHLLNFFDLNGFSFSMFILNNTVKQISSNSIVQFVNTRHLILSAAPKRRQQIPQRDVMSHLHCSAYLKEIKHRNRRSYISIQNQSVII